MTDGSEVRGPRVGFHVSAFGSGALLGALATLSRHGFEGLEVFADTSVTFAARPDEFRQILGLTGSALAGVHSGGLLTEGEYRDAEAAEWLRVVEWTGAAGGEYVVFYGGETSGDLETDLANASRFLDEMGRRATDCGVRLCWEPDRSCPFDTPEKISALLDRTDPAHVRLSVDTGHLSVLGIDPALFVVAHRRRIGVVHLRDLAAAPPGTPWRDRAVEPGEGAVPLREVIDALRAVRYEGWLVGVADRPRDSGAGAVARAAAYFRERLGVLD